MQISDLRISKNLKYKSLYWTLGYIEEETEDIFVKRYTKILTGIIDSGTQKFHFIGSDICFELKQKEDFVKLEFLDRLLVNNFNINKLVYKNDKFYINDYIIRFYDWDDDYSTLNNNEFFYKSRLYSGVLEFECIAMINAVIYDDCVFGENNFNFKLKKEQFNYKDELFEIKNNKLVWYKKKQKIIKIPEGTKEIDSCLFWDDQDIEEVILPESLKSIGGDTFYNCKNIKTINIPKNVIFMGNDPFGGCLNLKIFNHSPYFSLVDDVLYTNDFKKIIHYSPFKKEKKFNLPDTLETIGKHAFFMCVNLEKLILPKSLKRMENNPFSGCNKLSIINFSNNYHIIDDVIYNKFKTVVIGALNKIRKTNLKLLETTKTISRNSFWNCKGIKNIILPNSLTEIGYNPFVGCSNIKFISQTSRFKVVDGVLYNQDLSKLISYPTWKQNKKVNLLDSVIELERGAFSGNKYIQHIKLHNVNKINKSCFTNCINLRSVYCSDLIKYIGEWAFAYCKNLKNISVFNDTFIDKNAFANTTAKLTKRKSLSNYVIESDNIYTLTSMKMRYYSKIKSIIIDPPYNSKIDYIGYKDENFEDGYLMFMQKRLELSYDLLEDEGFLVIFIDEGEVDNLFKLSQHIFSTNNVSVHKWQKINKMFDMNKVVKNPNKIQEKYEYIILCKKHSISALNKVLQPYLEEDILVEKAVDFPEIFDFFGTTSSAKDEIKELFNDRDYFSTPKPLKLVKEIVRATTNNNSIVLDFFAGSGTLGHAVHQLNKEDSGHRKYILISNNESNICRKVTKKRMEIVGSKFVFIN